MRRHQYPSYTTKERATGRGSGFSGLLGALPLFYLIYQGPSTHLVRSIILQRDELADCAGAFGERPDAEFIIESAAGQCLHLGDAVERGGRFEAVPVMRQPRFLVARRGSARRDNGR